MSDNSSVDETRYCRACRFAIKGITLIFCEKRLQRFSPDGYCHKWEPASQRGGAPHTASVE